MAARNNSVTIEDVLDEENKNAIAEQTSSPSPTSRRTPMMLSPSGPYVGNRLGVSSANVRHSSIAGEGVGVTAPSQSRKTKLDPSDPSTWTKAHTPTSPVEQRPRAASETQESRPRAPSDSPGVGVPKVRLSSAVEDGPDLTAVENKSTIEATAKQVPPTIIEGPESAPANVTDASYAVTSPTSSSLDKSPPSIDDNALASLQASGYLLPSSSNTLAVHGDDNETDRRFSNQSASFSTMTDDSDRIGAVPLDDEKDDEDVLQYDSDADQSSSDQDEGSPVSERGRKRQPDRDDPANPEPQLSDSIKHSEAGPPLITVDEADDPRKSLPRAPEHSGKLSETQPENVTPRSNFNRAASPAALSQRGNDDDELARAKALELRVSPLDENLPGRTVKMLIRGAWNSFQDFEEVDQSYRHEPRLYLVCTDLSNEATYALEWTIGTLLKDGDTLLIVSAVEDDNAPKGKDLEEPSLEVRLESAKAAEEANSTMEALTRQTSQQQSDSKYEEQKKLRLAALKDQARSLSRSSHHSKKGEERVKAIDKLEADFLRFVRKTSLQVRCMIEIIHCRSPRHLILNAIDELEPTLVVVGTRGLGVVKNVVMGSFSNYLVQKSSIPVMVARKRLKKPHHAKVSSQQIRMTNNLTPFSLGSVRKSLTQARID